MILPDYPPGWLDPWIARIVLGLLLYVNTVRNILLRFALNFTDQYSKLRCVPFKFPN